MIIIKHELRQGTFAFLIWSSTIAALLSICIFLFPEMKGEMVQVSDMFSSMGSFTAAFGMDQLNFGTLIGFYTIECGNVLGLGGAFYASFCAAGMLSKEEKNRTAEFLFSHPVSRFQIVTEKLLAVMLQVTMLNGVIYIVAIIAMLGIGETIPWRELNLLHLGYYLMQLELIGICFGISAFVKRGSAGIGLGIATLMYFLNIIANITESVDFLKYITPFGFCDGAEIVTNQALNHTYVAIGMLIAVLGIVIAYGKYLQKDIHV